MYFKLPSNGVGYSKDVVEIPPNNELPVYPMTAIDEMTLRAPDGLFNGAAMVDLIKSCIPNIKDPWSINSIDFDASIIAIKAATGNGKMSVSSTCPACSEVTDFDVALLQILADIKDVNYDDVMSIRELKVKFRSLTYAETNQNNIAQFQVQKTVFDLQNVEDSDQKQEVLKNMLKKLGELVTDAVSTTIEYIETPETKVTDKAFIRDFLNNCDRETNSAIKDRSIDLRKKNDIKPLQVTCPECSHKYEQQIIINATDFFDIG
jgi:hypothetical protein